MTVHFTAKTDQPALEQQLLRLGFDSVRALPGGRKVMISASEDEFTDRLGLAFTHENMETRSGIRTRRGSRAVVSDSSGLPAQIAHLV